jgi:anaerobic magnesium-protoporphyrin IX monomethyl ester cyclase
VERVTAFAPQIAGLSMVYSSRGREFCRLAQALRNDGYEGHLIAGGHFASFNCERLLQDFPAFDSVALGEGEETICALADNLEGASTIPGLCYRQSDGSIALNPSKGNADNLDRLPFPKRATFRKYFDKPTAAILGSRGCWRNCAYCSISAWYKRVGGKRFRVRSVDNIVAEMKELYSRHGVRIFEFLDDNFFLPNPESALHRFEALRRGLKREGVEGSAIAVHARPDSITYDSMRVVDDMGLLGVGLGVDNASDNGLRNLNRECTLDQIRSSLQILGDFDVMVAYNILMFEPDTVMDDILTNLRFIERHMEYAFHVTSVKVLVGTGFEARLRAEGRLLGDPLGFHYRIKDRRSHVYWQIATHVLWRRNLGGSGLREFNRRIDFGLQMVRRFRPQGLTQTLRADVRSLIKQTNLDTYQRLCRMYDFVAAVDPLDNPAIRGFARQMREGVDAADARLRARAGRVARRLKAAYYGRGEAEPASETAATADTGVGKEQ